MDGQRHAMESQQDALPTVMGYVTSWNLSNVFNDVRMNAETA